MFISNTFETFEICETCLKPNRLAKIKKPDKNLKNDGITLNFIKINYDS